MQLQTFCHALFSYLKTSPLDWVTFWIYKTNEVTMSLYIQILKKLVTLLIVVSFIAACEHGGLTTPIDDPATAEEGFMTAPSEEKHWVLNTFVKVPKGVDSSMIVITRRDSILVKHIDRNSPLLNLRHFEHNDEDIHPQDTIVYDVKFFQKGEIYSIALDTIVAIENKQMTVIKTDQRPSFTLIQDRVSVNQEIRITELLLVRDNNPFTVDVEWKLAGEKEWVKKEDVMKLPKGFYEFLVRLKDAYGQLVIKSFFLEVIAAPLSSSVEQSSSSVPEESSSSEVVVSSSSEKEVSSSSELLNESSSSQIVSSSSEIEMSSSSEIAVVGSSGDNISSSSDIAVSSSEGVMSSSFDIAVSSSEDVSSSSALVPVNFKIVCNPACDSEDSFGSVLYPKVAVHVGDTLEFTADPLYEWAEVESWVITSGDAEMITNPDMNTQVKVVFNSSDVEITLTFKTKAYLFAMSAEESDFGEITIAQTVNVPIDTEIKLTATPISGYQFVKWSATMVRGEVGDKEPVFGDVNAASTTIKLYTGAIINAEFEAIGDVEVVPVIALPVGYGN